MTYTAAGCASGKDPRWICLPLCPSCSEAALPRQRGGLSIDSNKRITGTGTNTFLLPCWKHRLTICEPPNVLSSCTAHTNAVTVGKKEAAEGYFHRPSKAFCPVATSERGRNCTVGEATESVVALLGSHRTSDCFSLQVLTVFDPDLLILAALNWPKDLLSQILASLRQPTGPYAAAWRCFLLFLRRKK